MGKENVLETIKHELWKGFTTKEVVIGGRKWVLKSLNDGEAAWRDKFIPASASYGFVTAQKAPTVAVSLVSIDGVLVRDLFLSEEERIKSKDTVDATVKTWLKMIGFKNIDERYEVAQRIYEYVSELPPEAVDKLYKVCLELEGMRKVALDDLLKNA